MNHAGQFKRGERRTGRSAGTPNRVTADVKALAAKHGPAAVTELARLATGAESEQARVAACRELLDRAYGRPAQTISAAVDLRLKTAEEMSDAELALIALGGSGLG